MDAILIANECVDTRKKSRRPWILYKLDIEAYDHLNLEFLWKTWEKKALGADGLTGPGALKKVLL